MSWRVARALDKLLEQINEVAPKRSKISDGSIGDPAHSSRESDHNPNQLGVVCARDFTHDPENGADMDEITEALRESRDPRIKYVIWDGRMFSSYPTSTHKAWTWRPYTGVNLHTRHAHVSVQPAAKLYDSKAPWPISQKEWSDVATKAEIKEAVREVVREEVRKGNKELAVGKTQRRYDPDSVNIKKAISRPK